MITRIVWEGNGGAKFLQEPTVNETALSHSSFAAHGLDWLIGPHPVALYLSSALQGLPKLARHKSKHRDIQPLEGSNSASQFKGLAKQPDIAVR